MKRSLNIFAAAVLALASFQNGVAMDEAACEAPPDAARVPSTWEAPVRRAEKLKQNIIAAVVMMSLCEKIAAIAATGHAQDLEIASELKKALPDVTKNLVDDAVAHFFEQVATFQRLVSDRRSICSENARIILETMHCFLSGLKACQDES